MIHNSDLQHLRQRLDRIDRNILRLLDERLIVSRRVANVKEQQGLNFYDQEREREIMEELRRQARHPELRAALSGIYKPILEVSKTVQAARRLEIARFNGDGLTIGIIGYGRFGAFLADVLRKHWPGVRLLISSRSHPADNTVFFPLQAVAAADIVIPCVPISAFAHTLTSMTPFLRAESTVIDVCSVKVLPARWMKEIIGAKAGIIASHPMFGPDSTDHGTRWQGLIMALHNISAPIKLYQNYKAFWQRLGVTTAELTPEEHDRYAAHSMNYSHLLGRISELINIHHTPIDTKSFEHIYAAMQYVIHDSWELFRDMQKYNPFAAEMRRQVAESLAAIEKQLADKENS